MGNNANVLPVVALPGLVPYSLGNYLASLGLLRVLARRWPNVRAAWRDGVFHVVGGPSDLGDLAEVMMCAAEKGEWTPYDRGWANAQKESTKAKSGRKLAEWQASADEKELELFSAHAAPAVRVSFNPLLGSGGNAGKRAFKDGWKRAVEALMSSGKPNRGAPDADTKRSELLALLRGEPIRWVLKKLNAASWFSEANKLYNSGQRPYREEGISPWAMVLACEGLPFFAGSASRRLGARARAAGAFPFVVDAAAPSADGEAGRDLGEIWAPIWNRPMTVAEVTTLFSRGRAEIGGRGAVTPSAFAVAAMGRGVDAGITEFRRFVLGRTTSANTFEPRFEGIVPVAQRAATQMSDPSSSAATTSLERLLRLLDSLPRDRKVGNRWRFVGLRGPIEEALVRVSAAPNDPEAARALLDVVVRALDRVDTNKTYRDGNMCWEGLPLAWLPALSGDETPPAEARLALALVSAYPAHRPFTLYRYGAELQGRSRFAHPKTAPARWVWRPGPLPRVLGQILHRHLLDWDKEEREGKAAAPVRSSVPAPARLSDIEGWLTGEMDDILFVRWLSRLALFDWRFIPNEIGALARFNDERFAPSGAMSLYGALHPLFDLRPVHPNGKREARDLMPPKSGARTPAAARRIASLLRTGEIALAMDAARSRYAMARAPLATSSVPWNVEDPERLLAALMFPVSDRDRSALVQRWLRPQREPQKTTYA